MKSRGYLAELDGVRALGVLIVMSAHLYGVHWIQRVYFIAPLSVSVFFVLSGLLITRGLLHEQREGGISLPSFWKRRGARLLPVFYGTVIAWAIFWPNPTMKWLAVYCMNFIQDQHVNQHLPPIGHYWTLCVEEQFYLFWPILLTVLGCRLAKGLAIGGCVAAVLGAYLVAHFAQTSLDPYGKIYTHSLPESLPLWLGCLLAFGEQSVFKGVKRFILIGILLALGRLVPSLAHHGLHMTHVSMPWEWAASRVVWNGFTAAAIICFCVACPLAPVGWALRNPVLRWIGRISYGLYVYHYPMYYFLSVSDAHHRPGAARPLWIMLAVALSFATAAVSYYFIEKPIMRWAGRIHVRAWLGQKLNLAGAGGKAAIRDETVLVAAPTPIRPHELRRSA